MDDDAAVFPFSFFSFFFFPPKRLFIFTVSDGSNKWRMIPVLLYILYYYRPVQLYWGLRN